MTRALVIGSLAGKRFSLPVDAVTQTFVVLAKRGGGKTYTGSVLVEEMLDARQRACIIDPLGVWWGLRADPTGEPSGYGIVIVGGEHGDIPIVETAGHVIAELAADPTAPSLIIDLAELRKGAQKRFVTDFMETLYHRNRDPLHVVIDEADRFAPQRTMHGEEQMLGALEDLVRRGRSKGLGVTLISQRSAVLNKDVLSQAEVLVALRTVSPQDRAAIDAWVENHGDQEKRRQLMADLPSLPIGTAYVWSPGWLDVFARVNIRERRTFDSSATPKVGERPRSAKLRPVDLKALTGRMEATIAEADASNPAKLRAKVAALTRDLELARAKPVEKLVETIVEKRVPILTPEQERLIAEAITAGREAAAQFELAIANANRTLTQPVEQFDFRPATRIQAPPAPHQTAPVPRAALQTSHPAGPIAAATRAAALPDGAGGLRAGERKMLATLARSYPVRLSEAQLGTLAKFARKGGTFGAYMRTLKRLGLVEVGEDKLLTITPLGLSVAGVEPGNPMTAEEVRAQYRTALRAGERAMFDALTTAYPDEMSLQMLAEETGFERSGGTFGAYVRTLRRNGLVATTGDTIRATPTAMGIL